MKPITYNDCFKLVSMTLKKIQAYSPEAHTTTMMIIAHESGRGKHRRQVGADEPALGLGQMERETFDTCKKYGDRYKTYLERAGYIPDKIVFEALECNDELAIILIRVRLAMDTAALPKTPKEQAEFCKKFWNAGGEASANKYLNDWKEWKNE